MDESVDVTTRWSRPQLVCFVCDGDANIKINETWYCLAHGHIGLAASTRMRAEAAGIDPDLAEHKLYEMLFRLGAAPAMYRASLAAKPADARWSWTQACCEACWISMEGDHDPETNELIAMRIPVININKEGGLLDCCAWCGQPTFIGIYKREDPDNVPFPAWEVEVADEVE